MLCVHGEVWLPQSRAAGLVQPSEMCSSAPRWAVLPWLWCRMELRAAQPCPAGAEKVSDSGGVKALYELLLYLSAVQRLLKKFVVVIASHFFPEQKTLVFSSYIDTILKA